MPTPAHGPARLQHAHGQCCAVVADLDQAIKATSSWVSPNANSYEENLCRIKSKIQALADSLQQERNSIMRLFSEIPR